SENSFISQVLETIDALLPLVTCSLGLGLLDWLNPTTLLDLWSCVTPFSVRKERPVVSLRHPGDHPERLSTRGRCQRSDPFQHPPQRRYGKRWGCGPPSRLAWARERHGPTGRCACGDASLAMVCCRRGPGPVPSGFPRRLGPEPSGGHVTTHIPVSGCGRTHD